MKKEQYPIFQEPINGYRPGFIQDNMYHETGFPLGDSFPSAFMKYQPVGDFADKGYCLLGRDKCSPLCSGYSNNPCNLVTPVPGPQWQVQSASTVQNRLTNQQYTLNKCPLGPTVLRAAPECRNLHPNESREPTKVNCYSAQVPPNF